MHAPTHARQHRMAHRASPDHPARRECQEHLAVPLNQELLAHEDHPDSQELPARTGRMESMGREEQMVNFRMRQALQVLLDRLVLLERPDSLARTVSQPLKACPDLRVHPETMDSRERLVSPESLERTEMLESKEPAVSATTALHLEPLRATKVLGSNIVD